MALQERRGKDRQDEKESKEGIKAKQKRIMSDLRIENIAGGQKNITGGMYRNICLEKKQGVLQFFFYLPAQRMKMM